MIDERAQAELSSLLSMPVMPISPGIAVGPARIIKAAQAASTLSEALIASSQVEAEQQRLYAAIAQA
ncbi:MAG TPA: phosphoenolpyruvate-utilizing N-terminal domain-containing protein, partial [Ktedonobacteraceae bacterium]|nr:phosphoenolpyruvate-utilizing N-terminal domain-containing protein [Ktedonobacteraceae bacterium]